MTISLNNSYKCFMSLFSLIMENYCDPDPNYSEQIVEKLDELKELEEDFHEMLDTLDYALWAGPEVSSLNEASLKNLKKFISLFENHNYKEAKEYMEKLPVPVLVSVREFYNCFTNYTR